jgi:hypothetical protein
MQLENISMIPPAGLRFPPCHGQQCIFLFFFLEPIPRSQFADVHNRSSFSKKYSPLIYWTNIETDEYARMHRLDLPITTNVLGSDVQAGGVMIARSEPIELKHFIEQAP